MTREKAIELIKKYINEYKKIKKHQLFQDFYNYDIIDSQIEMLTFCLKALEKDQKTVSDFIKLFEKHEYVDLLSKYGLTLEQFLNLRKEFNELYKIEKQRGD